VLPNTEMTLPPKTFESAFSEYHRYFESSPALSSRPRSPPYRPSYQPQVENDISDMNVDSRGDLNMSPDGGADAKSPNEMSADSLRRADAIIGTILSNGLMLLLRNIPSTPASSRLK
jgi:hypothetical protein